MEKKNTISKNRLKKIKKLKIFMTGKVGTALVMAALKYKIISGKFYNEVITEMTNSNFLIYQLFKKHMIRKHYRYFRVWLSFTSSKFIT